MIASRNHWRLLTATVVAMVLAAFIAPRFIHSPDIQENRVLAAKPALPAHLADFKAFRKSADAYVSDRFPVRTDLIALLNRLRMLVGVSGSPKVIIGRNGWLFYDADDHLGAARNDPPWPEGKSREWLTNLAGRTEALRAQGIPYLVVAPPMKETIYPQFGPPWYHGPDPNRGAVHMARLAAVSGAGDFLYLNPAVAQATRQGLKTYSRHDTHWSGYGAYAGYAALMTRLHAMGLTEGPRPLSAFQLIPPKGANQPRDLALMLGVSSFVDVDYPHVEDPVSAARAKTTYLTDRQDWTAPHVIDTGEVGKPTVLLTVDSFSNELLPLMYTHFSRIIVAHNQDGTWREDLIARFKPNIVILEVIEAGIGYSLDPAPAPSAEAVARIDKALAAEAPAPAPPVAAAPPPPEQMALVPTAPPELGRMDKALPAANCNLEVSTLVPTPDGFALTLSGWISELAKTNTSPSGLARLQGPGVDLYAPIPVDRQREDVAAHFKVPAATQSGFAGIFAVKGLAPGSYAATIYRQAQTGWIACRGPQSLLVK